MLREYLRNENIKTIGVRGPIGVGKTTIMNFLQQEMEKCNDFEIVFWVSVGRRKNIEGYIQKELLKRLKIKLKNFSEEERKSMLYNQLKKYKSYLLLLDEVFSNIDLEKVGINDEQNGKVVFASRYIDVCEHGDEEIEVKRLSSMDAQNMFWEIVGVHLKDNPHIKTEAELIIKFCSGMPFLIKMIGNNLATKIRCQPTNADIVAIWRNTKHKLYSPTGKLKQELGEVYKLLQVEMEELSEDEKPCFLYLANFPAGHELHMDYIIECWRAEQFLNEFRKLGQARDEGRDILLNFVNKSLLEKGTKMGLYKMFEFYQRLAFRFAKHNENNYVQDKEMVREIKWEDATRISMFGDLCQPCLPDKPNSERILTLLLQEINSLAKFPGSFFVHMAALQLLDLYKTKIKTLPPSISSLRNLKAMFMKNCDQLIELCAEVGELRSLEILDIRYTGIYNLPMEIGKLTALKCLRVSFKKDIGNQNHVDGASREMISSDVIARLHSLEELGIVVDPTDGRWDQNVARIVAEIADLKELTTLCFYFPTLRCFETFVSGSTLWNGNNAWQGERLRSFSIVVGPQQGNSPTEIDVSEWSSEKRLRFSAGEAFPDAILKILKQAFSFELIAHKAPNLSVFSADNLEGLQSCTIEDCPEMISIIDSDLVSGVPFQCLTELHLDRLPKLMHIWKGAIVSGSLNMLKTLTLKGCHVLEFLFSQEVVAHLQELQYLQIEECLAIKEIIKDESIVDSTAFSKLKNLELINLPLLSTICHDLSIKWNALETLKINTCVKLTNFPSTFRTAEKLRGIHCSPDLWNQLVWPNDGDVTKDHLQKLHRPL
ncbi:hypothetical protein Pint_36254 [Pistacia integerrima]|uniref:Uncharacterized protein n=1 Tax=Pistacia integerrima TaxID=434235 RepID=A0ACC0Y3B5_9ROSI|nr:hypothetical protein Pint_36254 [Pistacia integerrima]